MRSLRKTLTPLSPAIILVSVLCGTISGQSALTTIQDTLFDADGQRYHGSLTIGWNTFDTGNPGTIVQQSRTVQVVNGNLLVQLAPNSTATPPANVYTVVYQSDGDQQYSETWTVPASTTSLKVAQVRTGTSTSGSGSAGGLTGSTGPVTESSVTNLLSDLGARPIKGPGFGINAVAVVDQNGQLETAVGNSTDCVFVDGTAGPCASSVIFPSFVTGETPAGTVNGLNTTFTLANTPSGSSLMLFRNGVLVAPGLDYTLTGSTIQFAGVATPQTQDTLAASYRIDAGATAGTGVAMGPSGVPGTNGCGAVGTASKSAAYQLQAADNGYLLIQTASAGLTLPATVPPAGWCVVALNTNAGSITVGNSGNTIGGVNAAYTLNAANAVTIVSDGSGYWLSGANGVNGVTGATGPAGYHVDRVFPSSSSSGTATTSLSLPSTNGCTPNVLAGVHVQSAVCTFAAGTQQYAYGHFPIPPTAPTHLYMDIKWRTVDANNSHSATFNWFYGSSAITPDPVLVSAGAVSTAVSSTSNQLQTSTIILPAPSVTPGDEFYFYLSRRGDTDSATTGVDVIEVSVHD
jgi:hypothetical protein